MVRAIHDEWFSDAGILRDGGKGRIVGIRGAWNVLVLLKLSVLDADGSVFLVKLKRWVKVR